MHGAHIERKRAPHNKIGNRASQPGAPTKSGWASCLARMLRRFQPVCPSTKIIKVLKRNQGDRKAKGMTVVRL